MSTPQRRPREILSRFSEHSWVGLLAIILLIVIVMSFVSRSFLSDFNLFVVFRNVSTAVIIGMSQMTVLAIGQMNLSVGGIGGLSAVVSGGAMDIYQLPVWVAVASGLGVGAACGLMNGIIIARTGINAFIVTIATASVFLGLNLGLTEAQPFYDLDAGYTAFGQARLGFSR